MSDNLTWTFDVSQPADVVYNAINDVRGWWSAGITGPNDHVGAEFSYWVPGLHYAKFRITEMVPARKVSWLVVDSWIEFVEDKDEWTGTTVSFEIESVDGGTHVLFTHEGLRPSVECYDACFVAWGGYVTGSLRELITSGVGRPNSIESAEAAERVRPSLPARV